MDDAKDDARCPRNAFGLGNQQASGSALRPKVPLRKAPSRDQCLDNEDVSDEHVEEDDEEEENDDDNDNEEGKIQNGRSCHVGNGGGGDYDDDKEQEAGKPKGYHKMGEDEDLQRHPKKRKLKNLISSYEFSPRATVISLAPKPSFSGRGPLSDWSEHETFVLLDVWGDKFLQLGRKSLRVKEWEEVAEKVSQESNVERTGSQCRNRLDTLKKKYKKEKAKLPETGCATGKWIYIKKMDMLMPSQSRQAGLPCRLESRKYVFPNPKVYSNRANGYGNETRDSPGKSETSADEENDSDEFLPPKRPSRPGKYGNEGSSFRLLADSIQKFSDVYAKIEKQKRKQMVKLERMRMDFTRELELQKRLILETVLAEIAKIH